jgi:hypothetical protein
MVVLVLEEEEEEEKEEIKTPECKFCCGFLFFETNTATNFNS